MIAEIDIAPLFGADSPARSAVDRAVMQAASGIGFMSVRGFPGAELLVPERRADLLSVFRMPASEKARLYRRNFAPEHANVYRGWFPLQTGAASYKEGIDLGPDIAHGPARTDLTDPLLEPTPLPPESEAPGWQEAARRYYLAMETVGQTLMRSIARGLGLEETTFDTAFAGGISTLRLIRYPLRPLAEAPEEFIVEHQGRKRALIGGAHVDSGFVTLLAQDGVEGLQARNHDGEWIDVPPADGTLAVNFGKLLDRWTGRRVRATLHRIVAPDRERFSIPFFYEPRVDAEIAPLPIAGAAPFEPYLYGDFLWEATTSFVELRGVKHLRTPRRPLPAAAVA